MARTLYRKPKKKRMGAAERAIEARLAGKGYAAVMRAAEDLDIPTAKPKKRKRSEWLEYIKTKIREIRYGGKTYAGKKFPPSGRRLRRKRRI